MSAKAGLRVRELTIADQRFRFDFSTMAIAALQDRWECETTDEALDKLPQLEKKAIQLLPDVLWAGLRRYHPETTIEDVRVLVNDHGIEDLPALMLEISKTIQASLPQGEGAKVRPLARKKTASR